MNKKGYIMPKTSILDSSHYSTLPDYSAAVLIDEKTLSAIAEATPEADVEKAMTNHLKWFFKDKVFIDKRNNFYLINDVEMEEQLNTSGGYWQHQYKIWFQLKRQSQTNMRAYCEFSMNKDEKLTDMYEPVLNHIYQQLSVKNLKDTTEMERILFL